MAIGNRPSCNQLSPRRIPSFAREIDRGQVNTIGDANTKVVYWHREFPPLEAEAIGEHTIEATSCRVPGTIAQRDDLWHRPAGIRQSDLR